MNDHEMMRICDSYNTAMNFASQEIWKAVLQPPWQHASVREEISVPIAFQYTSQKSHFAPTTAAPCLLTIAPLSLPLSPLFSHLLNRLPQDLQPFTHILL